MVSRRAAPSTGAILALVVVFRNTVSHQRYNDARSAISEVCAGIRSFAVVLHSTTTLEGLDEESKAAKPAFKEAVKLCIVRCVSCGCSHFARGTLHVVYGTRVVVVPVRVSTSPATPYCPDPLRDDHRGGAGLA
ncbi:bestrophin family ion channel [Silvimonas sp.]|uniref:bestrophin family ion channel n=1 Tax=Silvimonas sp. TaxID=2650811 RepID=UPI002851C377|nr:bestrophin family ion channel [Silvimonas sp.]MDR3427816.1 bestrophin family ion channel [Silvimonas sp.]